MYIYTYFSSICTYTSVNVAVNCEERNYKTSPAMVLLKYCLSRGAGGRPPRIIGFKAL